MRRDREHWSAWQTGLANLSKILLREEPGGCQVREGDVDFYGTEVTALREALISGFDGEVILLLQRVF